MSDVFFFFQAEDGIRDQCVFRRVLFRSIGGMDDGPSGKVITGEVPLAEMFGYATDLRSATQGRATFTMEPLKYSEVPPNVAEAVINKNE